VCGGLLAGEREGACVHGCAHVCMSGWGGARALFEAEGASTYNAPIQRSQTDSHAHALSLFLSQTRTHRLEEGGLDSSGAIWWKEGPGTWFVAQVGFDLWLLRASIPSDAHTQPTRGCSRGRGRAAGAAAVPPPPEAAAGRGAEQQLQRESAPQPLESHSFDLCLSAPARILRSHAAGWAAAAEVRPSALGVHLPT